MLLELQNAGYAVTHQRVQTSADLVCALHNSPWDVVICDHTMPKFDAFAALNLVKRSGLDIPFIIVSGTIGEDLAVMAMKAGAHDYIMKHNLTRLAPAIERELREAQVRQARRRAEEEVQKSLERLRRSMTETIQTMALMAEMRDPYTAGHQRRVADLAARHVRLQPEGVGVAAAGKEAVGELEQAQRGLSAHGRGRSPGDRRRRSVAPR
ncbi:MAG: response regulator [Planctomycetota bacterium]